VILPVTRSWLGKENTELESQIAPEMPDILNWALDGLARLYANDGHFTPVPSAEAMVQQIRDLASPVGAFVRERCVLAPDLQIEPDEIYAVYKTWAEESGYPRSSKNVFGRDLLAACPSVRKGRLWKGGNRGAVYLGIGWRKGETGDEPLLGSNNRNLL
jgi:putative DNA primase/helicase